ncbi:MAG: phosphatase [Gammaproteobacteria bacterium]
MKRFLILVKFTLCALFFSVTARAELLNPQGGQPFLAWDAENLDELPKNFRTTRDDFKLPPGTFLSLEGLKNLQASGSGQFAFKSLKVALTQMTLPVWVVDLRQESHGFIDGRPFTWYAYENRGNEGKTAEAIEAEQALALKQVKTERTLTIHTITDKDAGRVYGATQETIEPQNVQSEKELIEGLGLHYIRFYVQDRHAPDDSEVDRFVSWVQSLPSNTWAHFHCRAGSGRTTTFMVMYDILKNAKIVPLQDIIQRQALIGPKDLSKMPKNGPDWRRVAAENRVAFIEQFYEYAKSPNGYPQKSWREWKAAH